MVTVAGVSLQLLSFSADVACVRERPAACNAACVVQPDGHAGHRHTLLYTSDLYNCTDRQALSKLSKLLYNVGLNSWSLEMNVGASNLHSFVRFVCMVHGRTGPVVQPMTA